MSQLPSLLKTCLIRTRLRVLAFCSLIVLTIGLTEKLPAENAAVDSSRRVFVTCDLREDSISGTLVTRLQDHHLALKNFRAAESDAGSEFVVDPGDGSVWIDRDDHMDFETHPILRLLVLADEELPKTDRFLEQFSAGLREEGLTAGLVESLSSRTVAFEITVRLQDVPEPPVLFDVNLFAQVLDEFSTEFGSVSAANSQPSEALNYFIISGNEDGIFQINKETGILSLIGAQQLHNDMVSTHELQVLAENPNGLSATANVFVITFNETPRLNNLADPAAAPVAEQDSAATTLVAGSAWLSPSWYASDERPENPFDWDLKLHSEAESRVPLLAAATNSIESTPSDDVSEDSAESIGYSMIPQLATPIPNTGRIDTIELKDWLTATGNARQSVPSDIDPNAISSSASDPESTSFALTQKSVSQEVLQSLVALIVFVASFIAAAIAISRAASAQRKVLEDVAARHTEDVSAELLSHCCGVPERATECDEAPLEMETSNAANSEDHAVAVNAELCARIRLLEGELVARGQLIAELTVKLEATSHVQLEALPQNTDQILDQLEIATATLLRQDREPVADRTTRVQDAASSAIPGDMLSQILKHVESHASVCSTSALASVRSEQELTSNMESLSGWSHQSGTGSLYSLESTAFAVATLDEETEVHSELANLFASKKHVSENSPAPVSEVAVISVEQETVTPVQDIIAETDEDSHLDSVKRYLSQLLERSKESASPEDILVDRRKVDGQTGSTERRASPTPARKPVKSFLESYMSSHGGDLLESTDKTPVTVAAEVPDLPKPPLKQRTPVDVNSVRESMNSFRAVAMQSVENAVLSYDLRQAKGVVLVRSIMLTVLVAVTALLFLANTMEVIEIRFLPWLMAVAVISAMIELSQRVQSIHKQRKELVSGTLNSAPQQRKRRFKHDELEDTLVQ